MASATTQFLYYSTPSASHAPHCCVPALHHLLVTLGTTAHKKPFFFPEFYSHRNLTPVLKSSLQNDGVVAVDDDGEDGILLGTLKLPLNTDLQRFKSLLFQWANSLSQGANLPYPVPLKVDKIAGARLGFITIGEGKTEVPVYIDCLVFTASDDNDRPGRPGAQKHEKPSPRPPEIG